MELCRGVIRQSLTKEAIEKGAVEELCLPNTIKNFLTYDRRVTSRTVALVPEESEAMSSS